MDRSPSGLGSDPFSAGNLFWRTAGRPQVLKNDCFWIAGFRLVKTVIGAGARGRAAPEKGLPLDMCKSCVTMQVASESTKSGSECRSISASYVSIFWVYTDFETVSALPLKQDRVFPQKDCPLTWQRTIHLYLAIQRHLQNTASSLIFSKEVHIKQEKPIYLSFLTPASTSIPFALSPVTKTSIPLLTIIVTTERLKPSEMRR